jgi:hypothetical protein
MVGLALVLVLGIAVVGGATGPEASKPSDLIAKRFFVTPGKAAYCYLGATLAPENPVLACWTPNDGFVASIAHDDAGRGGQAGYGSADLFRDHKPSRGYPLLRFGRTFQWRCLEVDGSFAERCSRKRGRTVFKCVSRKSGLTCANRKGGGFWLGRYRGYRVF